MAKILGSGASSRLLRSANSTAAILTLRAQGYSYQDIQGDTDQKHHALDSRTENPHAGDVLFDDIHVYTAEADSNARAKWLDTLTKVRELRPSVVVAGHSKVGAALDASTAVDFTERYLLAFNEELKTAKDRKA